MVANYEDLLIKIAGERINKRLFFTCALLNFVVMDDTMGMGMAAVAATCDFKMDSLKKAIFTSVAFLGIICSSYFWGYICDIRGRRKVLLITTFSSSTSSLLSVWMPNFWLFILMRFVTGLFLAGPAGVTAVYLGEFCTRKNLSQVINSLCMFTAFATIYCPSVGYVLLPQHWAYHLYGDFYFTPWRLQLIFYALPGLIGAISLLSMPDSPAFLLSMHKTVDAYDAFKWLCLHNTGQNIEFVFAENDFREIAEKLAPKSSVEDILSFKVVWNNTVPIFKKPLVFKFSICCLIMCGLFFVGNGVGLWYPSLRGLARSHNESVAATICDLTALLQGEDNERNVCKTHVQHSGAMDSILLGVYITFCFIVQGVVLRFVGRRWTMIFALTVSGLCGVSLYWMVDEHYSLMVLIVYISMPTLLIAVMSSGLLNMMPTQCRGKALCICLIVGRFGAVLSSNLLGSGFGHFCTMSLLAYPVYAVVSILFLMHLPIDDLPP